MRARWGPCDGPCDLRQARRIKVSAMPRRVHAARAQPAVQASDYQYKYEATPRRVGLFNCSIGIITRRRAAVATHTSSHSRRSPSTYYDQPMERSMVVRTFSRKAWRSVRKTLAASMLAGDSSFGAASMDMTDRRIFSTDCTGDQRSTCDS
eukprot:c16395_g1_i2.p1 GENE.c16395_g1_i2~~c16395_g1_i2.p1  ORF type:complete len:151 (-),score=9.22 c16395_g1_i2:62-514(-)